MPSLKLMYFNARGRAETARLLLALAGVEYEDYRFGEGDWPRVKATTPLGQVPVLVIDGEMISQSRAIERYIARKYGFHGKTDIDQARIDMFSDTAGDIGNDVVPLYLEKDEAKKAELRKKLETEKLPGILDSLEKLLKENKGGDGFIVGDSITVADVALANKLKTLTTVLNVYVDFSSRPKLEALVSRVYSQPKIVEWIAKRPDTKF